MGIDFEKEIERLDYSKGVAVKPEIQGLFLDEYAMLKIRYGISDGNHLAMLSLYGRDNNPMYKVRSIKDIHHFYSIKSGKDFDRIQAPIGTQVIREYGSIGEALNQGVRKTHIQAQIYKPFQLDTEGLEQITLSKTIYEELFFHVKVKASYKDHSDRLGDPTILFTYTISGVEHTISFMGNYVDFCEYLKHYYINIAPSKVTELIS